MIRLGNEEIIKIRESYTAWGNISVTLRTRSAIRTLISFQVTSLISNCVLFNVEEQIRGRVPAPFLNSIVDIQISNS